MCFLPFQCLASGTQPHPLRITMTLSVQISVWRCPLIAKIIINAKIQVDIHVYTYRLGAKRKQINMCAQNFQNVWLY